MLRNLRNKIMKCNCIKELDEKLKSQNLQITGCAYAMPDFRLIPTIKTDWIDKNKAPKGKKNSPPYMFASHCPFCGIKLEDKV